MSATRPAEPHEQGAVGRVYFGSPRVPADLVALVGLRSTVVHFGGRTLEWDGEDDDKTVPLCSECQEEPADDTDELGRCVQCQNLNAMGAPSRRKDES